MAGLAIRAVGAVAWSALAVGVVGAGLLSAVLALRTTRPTPTLTAPARAVDPTSSHLERNLNDLLTSVLGPGQAVVSADVTLNSDRTSATQLRYGHRGIALNTAGSRISAANGAARMRRRSGSMTWAHNERLTTTAYAPGAVRRISLGVIVNARVPTATVRTLKRELGTAAGLRRSRGDTISVTRASFAQASTAGPLARTTVRSAIGLARWALLGLGLGAFVLLAMLDLRRRESASLVHLDG
ncbi:flagellar M-ring protein FliF C-terminal domain-containing protein [Solirubrobacter soli]|uniref:flagellar M-ring protein FliF C-terminal domain-containing protein n=1 Tax=Solirubrobacter soli TaxID=363832 RepID=UPI000420767E|nr:flagellar M-ring protein FliF C-terminal domain-containing protein [Solirubrobacter soli]